MLAAGVYFGIIVGEKANSKGDCILMQPFTHNSILRAKTRYGNTVALEIAFSWLHASVAGFCISIKGDSKMNTQSNLLIPTPYADELATDLEIWQADREMLAELVESILENKRLAGMLVGGWLKKHGMVMIKETKEDQHE